MTGLYMHIPFCLKKCGYCSFTSYAGMEGSIVPYVTRMLKELRQYPRIPIDSIYVGGGTPTLLGEWLLFALMDAAHTHFDVKKDCEITIETNPAVQNKVSFTGLKAMGINRLSIGVQSFNDKELDLLGRVHTAKDAVSTYTLARNGGFDNISIDLMFALPRQSIRRWNTNVKTAIELQPEHICTYSLSIEEDVPLCDLAGLLPSEDLERGMYWTAANALTAAGYKHYEISNFAKPGKLAYHNTKYWTRHPYIGIGAGAHSFYKNERYENTCSVEKYINSSRIITNRVRVLPEDAIIEKYMLGLRMLDGVRYDRCLPVDDLVEQGLLCFNGDKLALTKKGIDLANYVVMRLFP